jgi:sterol desaturase/sphingolipid hydroxylase (fatty acid hydroxylase superfamily)
LSFFSYDAHDHNVHHYYGQQNCNFGLFTTIPDRLLGTYKALVPTAGRLDGKTRVRGSDGSLTLPNKDQ